MVVVDSERRGEEEDLMTASLKCISGAGDSYLLDMVKQAQILQEGCVS